MVSISEKDYNKLMKELSQSGMTDAQWKSYLRGLIAELERALEDSPDNKTLQLMIARLKVDLES